jgi:hypothetical protein
MSLTPPWKDNLAPDVSKPEIRAGYVTEVHNATELLHKELDINIAEQSLLCERIREMTVSMNDLPSFDPRYSMLAAQIQMDQIELDEVRRREVFLVQELNDLSALSPEASPKKKKP